MVGTDIDPSLTAEEAGQLAMMQIVLIGLGAGAAAALLFASVASGSICCDAAVLSRAAADPDRRARLEPLGRADRGGHRRRRPCAPGLACISSPHSCSGSALPAWWLGYLALLARPAPAGASVEWYPVGRLVLWAALHQRPRGRHRGPELRHRPGKRAGRAAQRTSSARSVCRSQPRRGRPRPSADLKR